MTITVAKHSGFCFGVEKAVELAYAAIAQHPNKPIYTLGKLIHNEIVTNQLCSLGVKELEMATQVPDNSIVIIRSHGVAKSVYDTLAQKGVTVIDATCPFVTKIQHIVHKQHNLGNPIIILGKANHPEVVGINGWCGNSAYIIESEEEIETLNVSQFGLQLLTNITQDGFDKPKKSSMLVLDENYKNNSKNSQNTPKKVCVVAQTTFDVHKYAIIVKKIQKQLANLVEIFDTICYTTYRRQSEAENLAKKCDVMLVLGSKNSSNTTKLVAICEKFCKRTHLISDAAALGGSIQFKLSDCIGIAAGASTPKELITEVKNLMAQQFKSEIQSAEFLEAIEGSPVNLREGKHVKGTVISADEKGISLNIASKKDGFIPAEEVCLGEYNPAEYAVGIELEAIVVTTRSESGCILLSKKRVDEMLEGDKMVETIRNGEIFELVPTKDIKGGLLSKLGNYTVFIPSSQIREAFLKEFKNFVGKTLRVTALEIDDKKRKIIASARKVLEEERKAREEIFWSAVQPDVIVNGKVKRITNFGAFVSVDGFDCLVHITDLSWGHLKSAEDVIKIGKSYDFLVLSVDKERNRVSLSYKALQPHPFDACIEKYPVGSITKGKITSIVPFGAFVEVAPGAEGLVHVSEASHSYIKSVSEVVKVGDEVDVLIKEIDTLNRKITLSIKACLPEVEAVAVDTEDGEAASGTGSKAKAGKSDKSKSPKRAAATEGTGVEWTDEVSNNPFAALLKGQDVEA